MLPWRVPQLCHYRAWGVLYCTTVRTPHALSSLGRTVRTAVPCGAPQARGELCYPYPYPYRYPYPYPYRYPYP